MPERQGSNPDLTQMHWDISKLLELGVDSEFLLKSNISEEEARDLVKGLLYLRERYPATKA